MKLFRKTRTRIGLWLLNNQAKNAKRNIKAINLKQAKSIGIVFDAGDKGIVDEVNRFVKSQAEFGTQFSLLGYIPEHVKEHSYISDKKRNYFSVQDLNFLMQPNLESITGFINTSPDLLVVLSKYYYFPLHYVVKLSKASFKVGGTKPFGDDLDFMIDLIGHEDLSLTDQLIHYLGKLNQDQA